MELANPQGPMFPHLCGGLEIHSKSHCQFVAIFGYLTSLGESWNMMNLALLQNFDPGLKTVKHCLCQHWIIIARARATSMISRDVSPIALLTRNMQGEVVSSSSTTDLSFPSSFDRDRHLNNSLRLCDKPPNFNWTQVSRMLVSLDWNFQQDKIPSFEEVLRTTQNSDKLRGKFAGLVEQEVFHMVHVQLALFCSGVGSNQ